MSGQRTGPSPLAVEAATALLLGTFAARVHPGLVLAAACRPTLCGVPLAFIDAAVHRLPVAALTAALGDISPDEAADIIKTLEALAARLRPGKSGPVLDQLSRARDERNQD